MPYRARRVDANQSAIVEELRAHGVSVAITSSLGNGFPDLVCGHRGKNWCLELKDPAQPKSKRALTRDEIRFAESWKGQWDVIQTAAEALEIMGVRK